MITKFKGMQHFSIVPVLGKAGITVSTETWNLWSKKSSRKRVQEQSNLVNLLADVSKTVRQFQLTAAVAYPVPLRPAARKMGAIGLQKKRICKQLTT